MLIAVTAGYRAIMWPTRGAALQAEAVDPGAAFGQMPVDRLADICGRIDSAVAQTGADVAIFDVDRIAAYGCAAQNGPSVITVYPAYDRRRWVLEMLDHPRPAGRVLFFGPTPGACDQSESCAQIDAEIVAIDLNGRSPIQLIRDLGLTVRPF